MVSVGTFVHTLATMPEGFAALEYQTNKKLLNIQLVRHLSSKARHKKGHRQLHRMNV